MLRPLVPQFCILKLNEGRSHDADPPEVRKDVLSGALTCVLGILRVGVGIYFLILRPPLLPEDLRRTGVDPNALPPAFVEWLFSTWGGFIVGFGATLRLSGDLHRKRQGTPARRKPMEN